MNEGQYCWVDQGSVVQGPQLLPQNWQDPNTGTWYYNVNNDDLWSDPNLLSIGWYPYVLVDAGEPGPYYDKSVSAFQVQATEVVQTVQYTQWDIERVRTSKGDEMEGQITLYTTNELAINKKVSEYAEADAKWLVDQQAELTRITVWDDVANFDAAKPVVLALPNSHIGASYVTQGKRMQAENDAAIQLGLVIPWDQAELTSFAAANQLAADDSSDSVAPLKPSYKLRQGIAVTSEQFARIVIARVPRDDPDPALRTAYKIRILRREDTRNLYVFSYTNGTQLKVHLFVDLGGGMWGVEADPAELPDVLSDMAFIFSYGSNPAVEADYFTERVEFPAGVATKQILVSWDTE